jgi:GNAT superfamily N-acetyltransferase
VNEDLYQVQPLGSHDRSAFSCGEDELDRYFREHAGQDQRRNVASCFVLVRRSDQELVGYYTLSATDVAPTELPASLARRLPRYAHLPAILLGRLAVDRRFHGQGVGRLLLGDALGRARQSTSQVAAVVVLVDALNEVAAQFYEALGFERLEGDGLRLFIPVASIPDA